MPAASSDIDDLIAEFELLDDWEERYRHVIDLGRSLEVVTDAERDDSNRVHGCASRVWLVTDELPGPPKRLAFRGDSDAHIVRGLVAVVSRMFSGRTPEEILSIDARGVFDRLGLSDHLSLQRSNGVNALIERIRTDAVQANP